MSLSQDLNRKVREGHCKERKESPYPSVCKLGLALLAGVTLQSSAWLPCLSRIPSLTC